jgi:hypothetical protein
MHASTVYDQSAIRQFADSRHFPKKIAAVDESGTGRPIDVAESVA